VGWAWIFRPCLCIMAKRRRGVYDRPESKSPGRAGRGFVVRDQPWTPFWTAVAIPQSGSDTAFAQAENHQYGTASSCARKRRRRSRSAGAFQDTLRSPVVIGAIRPSRPRRRRPSTLDFSMPPCIFGRRAVAVEIEHLTGKENHERSG
jgi:hypothetical protein